MSDRPDIPIVLVTMGDPAGIGPEVAVRAAVDAEARRVARVVLVGDSRIFSRAAGWCGVTAPVTTIDALDQRLEASNRIEVIDIRTCELADFETGRVSAVAGNAAFVSVRRSIQLALGGAADAVATGPLHKGALHAAGHRFPGHTEIFADLTGAADYTMMLAEGAMRVSHVSTHVALRAACDAVRAERVLNVISLTHAALLDLGVAEPRIGVAGLNPHAGDGGLFGQEEHQEIAPAIAAARERGIDAHGPFPADTLFPMAAGGAWDACVAMYHDQGHTPVKLLGFKYDGAERRWISVRGINVTLGLPIIRTSVDHGTAFDQAGKGTANAQSMVDAICYAALLAQGRRRRTAFL